jgi:CheY-like chemotaxis protein
VKVLVIDDEPLVRLSLQRALTRNGHEVRECEDGRAALTEWPAFRPELVYLDVLMPRLTGPELLKALPESEKKLARVILMSAFGGEYDLNKAKSLGAQLFIAKPFADIFHVVQQGEELFGGHQNQEK